MTPRVEVSCELGFDVVDHASMAVQIAVARSAGVILDEQLTVWTDGEPVAGIAELDVDHGGRLHTFDCGRGELVVTYRATVEPATVIDDPVGPADAIVGLRQSRYCPSDALEAFAHAEHLASMDRSDRGRAVAEWVHHRLTYELDSSGSLDTAVDTLLAGRGVCRDFAHLTIALCRAVGVPARLVSVYAPGISPMDFHAVAEVAPDGTWEVVDATRLAPRQSLVRIGTGRDASDTAFATTLDGSAELVSYNVVAVTQGALPLDDHRPRVTLP